MGRHGFGLGARWEKEAMNADPLEALKDIYLPPPPPWWPPAPGWWLVAAVLLIALIGLAVMLYRRWRAFAPVRAAKQLVTQVFISDAPDHVVADQCNDILKRLLVVALHKRALGPQSGDTWLRALDRIAGCEDFSQGPGRALGAGRFAPNQPIDRAGLRICMIKLLDRVKPDYEHRGRHD